MSSGFNLLIVEDDPALAASLKLMAPSEFKVYVCQKPALIPEHVFFHAALIDMHIETEPGQVPDGPAVIKKVFGLNPEVEIISMSGNLDRNNMEMAITSGARRFLAKPINPEELILLLSKILAYWQIRTFSPNFDFKILGKSAQTEVLKKTISLMKNEPGPILIEGETGTGKEVIAKTLNQQEGPRPFITVNCSALNETIFESEFFGHVKGAFTGADQNKMGLAEMANGGDLFLDEIEALPLSQQAKLLRFLESGEVRRVGDKNTINVKTRVIAASNIPLKKLVSEKKFREDLYYRLNKHLVEITPLKERTDDIPELAQFFLDKEKPYRNKKFSESAFEALKKYSWPGNIRELKRICEQLSLKSPLPIIEDVDVTNLINPSVTNLNESSLSMDMDFNSYLSEQEKRFLTYHLQKNKNVDEVSQQLGISKSNLYKKIKDHNINYEST